MGRIHPCCCTYDLNLDKTKRLEYFQKRFDLIEKLLQSEHIESNKNKLKEELDEIAVKLSLTSIKSEEFASINYSKKPFLTKIFVLPKISSIGGKIGLVVYYLYGITGLLYIPLSIALLISGDLGEDWYIILIAIFGSFTFALLARIAVVKGVKREAIVEKAKRLLF